MQMSQEGVQKHEGNPFPGATARRHLLLPGVHTGLSRKVAKGPGGINPICYVYRAIRFPDFGIGRWVPICHLLFVIGHL